MSLYDLAAEIFTQKIAQYSFDELYVFEGGPQGTQKWELNEDAIKKVARTCLLAAMAFDRAAEDFGKENPKPRPPPTKKPGTGAVR